MINPKIYAIHGIILFYISYSKENKNFFKISEMSYVYQDYDIILHQEMHIKI